jgi:hypothetical protein
MFSVKHKKEKNNKLQPVVVNNRPTICKAYWIITNDGEAATNGGNLSCLSCCSAAQNRYRCDRGRIVNRATVPAPKKIYKWLWDSSESACSSSSPPSLCASQDKASEFDSLSLSLNERPVLGIKRVSTPYSVDIKSHVADPPPTHSLFLLLFVPPAS